jgi:hypothetical protein
MNLDFKTFLLHTSTLSKATKGIKIDKTAFCTLCSCIFLISTKCIYFDRSK